MGDEEKEDQTAAEETEGQPSTDPSVYHEGVEPGAVGAATEEDRPAPEPPDIYKTEDDGESEEGAEEEPEEK